MSNLLKTKLSVIFSMLILVGVLVGCSDSDGEANASQGDDAASDGPVEIEFWYGQGGTLAETIERFISEFNEKQDDVIVTGVTQGNYDETYQKLQAAIAAKEVPAVVLLENDMTRNLIEKEALASMDSFIDSTEDFNADDFVPSFYQQGTVDGSQYALPLYGTTQIMYYRNDVFEEMGLTEDVFKTWESLEAAAAKIKDEKDIAGWMPMWGTDNLIDASLSRGGEILSEDGTEVLIASQEWIDTWEFFRTAIHEDESMAINHGGQGWEYWYKTIDDVMQGNAFGYTGSSGDQGDLDFDILSAAPQPGWESHAAAPFAGALLGTIPATASEAQQQAGFEFLSFFTSAEKTADWSMSTGYIPVRNSATEVPAFAAYAEENPQSLVPLEQAQTATPPFVDPTGGKILDALSIAADKVEIEGVSAEEALTEAQEVAQNALDSVE
ncbi:ABC transporter substrate-binding protein [Aquibacillus rhizosphaerae]|uniref:ABC transporter substrate-binding protein n=1 Tax=Aquibacillus rhizosphaerae TaxID=3051431 RepID=A0ABT7L0E6_9BACI|nr:ABC transporter substrate-binding protein [Aquibacillus sp. LR5S19]MDL4839250.1 ABC transporter substrate-binding protein [Aquibacillus sp. LR5S19]